MTRSKKGNLDKYLNSKPIKKVMNTVGSLQEQFNKKTFLDEKYDKLKMAQLSNYSYIDHTEL